MYKALIAIQRYWHPQETSCTSDVAQPSVFQQKQSWRSSADTNPAKIALDMTQKKEQVEQSLTKMGHNIIYHSPLAKA